VFLCGFGSMCFSVCICAIGLVNLNWTDSFNRPMLSASRIGVLSEQSTSQVSSGLALISSARA
jgi:hypothetical protein